MAVDGEKAGRFWAERWGKRKFERSDL